MGNRMDVYSLTAIVFVSFTSSVGTFTTLQIKKENKYFTMTFLSLAENFSYPSIKQCHLIQIYVRIKQHIPPLHNHITSIL
ncbi:hypothetical protein K450DRAFT_262473 [Umbelopsis ramanniana AG]|uniref:Uncharacterized protein n=1 Tax=Umbelopsis ramanniana AG TaxID=1314678 RepID=A0AAD5E2P3_UMBRA|nr:uncharacterized protein K450DRAFT_262473 [Umbelopsis ramanniana AG]KAI8575300.1 hypothetical protein K450DRAFT_262473 [Umbelopsis ramanniana AG]